MATSKKTTIDDLASSPRVEQTVASSPRVEQTPILASDAAGAASLASQQSQQIAELKEMVASLMQSVQESQARKAQTALLQDDIAEVKADIRQARAMLVQPNVAEPRAVEGKEDGGDCGCGCVNSNCCCFEIVLGKVRAIQPQGLLEPADSGDAGPLINELEVRIFASIDNIGVLIPSLSTTMGLRVPGVLGGGGPGLWMPLDRVIGRVCLKKGNVRTITVDFQASEVDEGLERVIGFKDEHGDASGSITLDCCMSRIYPPTPTDLSFDHGGTGGGAPGAISLAFYARRVCC